MGFLDTIKEAIGMGAEDDDRSDDYVNEQPNNYDRDDDPKTNRVVNISFRSFLLSLRSLPTQRRSLTTLTPRKLLYSILNLQHLTLQEESSTFSAALLMQMAETSSLLQTIHS